ncbi:MAG: hypothetical protein ACOVQE_08990 [Chitinophagaceae bacterium]
MIQMRIIFWEWKHFVKNPFKILALLLFVAAGVYGLHNGANLYNKQMAEIKKLTAKANEQEQKIISYYDKGEKGPADRPWIDVTTPFWAIWNLPTYYYKTPSPAMVFGIGQAEQYGFYKQLSVWASIYDPDMTNEIANPERLQSGNLDFSFILFYLSPLLLLIISYQISTTEKEQGFLPLINVQIPSINQWILSRLLFYFFLIFITLIALIFYGCSITPVFKASVNIVPKLVVYSGAYLAFWTLLYFMVLKYSSHIMNAALKMIALWLLFAFLIPAAVHQSISIAKPANLMLNFIDVQREGRERIFNQPDSVIDKQLIELFPTIKKAKLFTDTTQRLMLRNYSASGLAYQLVKSTMKEVESDSDYKNKWVQSLYWIMPVTFFQNKFNEITETDYYSFENYRQEVDKLIYKRINTMVLAIWNGDTVNKSTFLKYKKELSSLQ